MTFCRMTPEEIKQADADYRQWWLSVLTLGLIPNPNSSENRRPDSDRASSEGTAAATERPDADGRALLGGNFQAARGTRYVDRKCDLACGFAGPVHPHRQGRNPPRRHQLPEDLLRNVHACEWAPRLRKPDPASPASRSPTSPRSPCRRPTAGSTGCMRA